MPPEALHVAVVLSPFILLPAAGWLGGHGARYASLLALVPAALTAYFGFTYWLVSTAGAFTVTLPWAPNLGLSLSFHLDGLGLMFATLITAIGVLIVGYAAKYLDGHKDARKFHLSLFAFMGAMLGVVLADNVLTLFVFWELTGFTSYLLIGFEHERPEARAAALQALLVTGAGGLALLAAGILLSNAGGTSSLSLLREQRIEPHERSGVRRHRHPGSLRGLHEVCAVPLSLLVAQRDAGSDACQRVSALRHHGEGWRVPDRQNDAAARRHRAVGAIRLRRLVR